MGQILKRLLCWIGLFGCGVLSNLFLCEPIFYIWFGLGWRKPIAHWMLTVSWLAWFAPYWGLIWINVPYWIMAFGWGALVGRLSKRHWPANAAFIAAGTQAWELYIRAMTGDWEFFSVGIPYSTIEILLIFCTAWFFHRRKVLRQNTNRGFAVEQTTEE